MREFKCSTHSRDAQGYYNVFLEASNPFFHEKSTGWPGCLVLRQGAVNQLFFGVFLMFLACLDHARWAQFHSGILGPQEWKKSSDILSWKKVRFQDLLKLTFFWFLIFWLFVHNFLQNHPNVKSLVCFEKFRKFAAKWAHKFSKLKENCLR